MLRRVLIATLVAGVPYGAAMGLFFAARTGRNTLWLGVSSGLAFGLLLAAFVEWQRRARRQPPPGVTIRHDGPANHMRGAEAVGGWLYLLQDRLLFHPHRFNIQKEDLSIPLAEVVSVKPRRTMGLIPNGIEVATRSGVDRFVVQGRGRWVTVLTPPHNRAEVAREVRR
jgi:hypothetical protein